RGQCNSNWSALIGLLNRHSRRWCYFKPMTPGPCSGCDRSRVDLAHDTTSIDDQTGISCHLIPVERRMIGCDDDAIRLPNCGVEVRRTGHAVAVVRKERHVWI